jgi:hypothetical protein
MKEVAFHRAAGQSDRGTKSFASDGLPAHAQVKLAEL